ncbi:MULTISPECIES: exodeoxyribonuclease III [Sphingobium]|uniref:exodeoxyribonuclease III n=1 Tax=Sphingobium TaxID=165695 RepID=UPI0015ECB998|nr:MULTISPECIES: exodeoxyribonuclease III [Sphingobium]MCW2364073.1 exodeoxyribonuclease-3 [Sphingobium sp. B10D3B]MCW2368535.1 exodeoxyribonuclease-3 [Sphingobium sp. B11D3D]MCW2402530.1 exodeoxyribonuclease-3 [Sphingobium sp. B10D7B]MCW2409509.1 exodeoxyribonuclease-3 [Sphingobium xanthum]
MRIATFNINGIKARLPRLVEWLTETQPDVACLQEIKTQDEGFPIKDIEDAGYGAIWHGQKGFNGVAILAKGATPQEVTRGLEGEPEDEHSRYIEADVNGVRIASIYLPNGNPVPGPKFEYKLRWMARLRTRAAQIWAEEVPAVLAGDYNVIPFDRDVWSPPAMASDALMQPESRAAYKTLLNDGWTDALAARHPLGGVWTFWDYQAGAWQRDAGFRIDHLLLSPTAADRLVDAQVDKAYRGREKASDHAPVWVRLKD